MFMQVFEMLMKIFIHGFQEKRKDEGVVYECSLDGDTKKKKEVYQCFSGKSER
ncbi:hypothetical protein NPIL_63251, partial [Nephila pilipes]